MAKWKTIPSHKGYQASDDGRVRGKMRIVKNNGRNTVKKPAKQVVHTGDDGYQYVMLSKKNKLTKMYVHRAVMEAHVGECPEDMTVDHIDRNRQNNTLENLRYATKAEQTENRVLNPDRGEDSSSSILTEDQVHKIRERYENEKISYVKLGSEYGVSKDAIRKIIKGETWTHI